MSPPRRGPSPREREGPGSTVSTSRRHLLFAVGMRPDPASTRSGPRMDVRSGYSGSRAWAILEKSWPNGANFCSPSAQTVGRSAGGEAASSSSILRRPRHLRSLRTSVWAGFVRSVRRAAGPGSRTTPARPGGPRNGRGPPPRPGRPAPTVGTRRRFGRRPRVRGCWRSSGDQPTSIMFSSTSDRRPGRAGQRGRESAVSAAERRRSARRRDGSIGRRPARRDRAGAIDRPSLRSIRRGCPTASRWRASTSSTDHSRPGRSRGQQLLRPRRRRSGRGGPSRRAGPRSRRTGGSRTVGPAGSGRPARSPEPAGSAEPVGQDPDLLPDGDREVVGLLDTRASRSPSAVASARKSTRSTREAGVPDSIRPSSWAIRR